MKERESRKMLGLLFLSGAVVNASIALRRGASLITKNTVQDADQGTMSTLWPILFFFVGSAIMLLMLALWIWLHIGQLPGKGLESPKLTQASRSI